MFLLKKVFQLRDKANPEYEKPFLDHLEDLRIMITRIVVTLLISMILCFSFQEKLMDVLRKPVDEVRLVHSSSQLPERIDPEDWENAKKVERASAGLAGAGLDPELSGYFLEQFDDADQRLVGIVRLLRAVAVLPDEKRADFLARAEADEPLVTTVTLMLEKGANPDIDSRGNLQLMSALRPTETFMLSMKLSFFAGIVVSFPLLLMYILQFVLPGLHRHETKVLWPAMAIGFGLFLAGVCFAYFIVLPRALEFFFEWSLKLGVSNDWRIGEYITFATQFTLLFGLSFELPVVVMVLVKLGLLTYETMSRTRSYAILAIFIVAAIITPTPDALTLILMATPMALLYELCIWLAYYNHRKSRRQEEAEERERMERLLMDVSEDGEEEDHGDHPDDGQGVHSDDGHGDAHPDDHWDPSACEEGWNEGAATAEEPAGREPEDDTPPESIPDEEKRRMSDPDGKDDERPAG